jgi:hypothetical protein
VVEELEVLLELDVLLDVVLVVVVVVALVENVFESMSLWLPEPQLKPGLCGERVAVIVIWAGGLAAVA